MRVSALPVLVVGLAVLRVRLATLLALLLVLLSGLLALVLLILVLLLTRLLVVLVGHVFNLLERVVPALKEPFAPAHVPKEPRSSEGFFVTFRTLAGKRRRRFALSNAAFDPRGTRV